MTVELSSMEETKRVWPVAAAPKEILIRKNLISFSKGRYSGHTSIGPTHTEYHRTTLDLYLHG